MTEYNVITHQGDAKRFEVALNLSLPLDRDIYFLCIGTDRITGDAFGPLIGTKLQQLGIPNVMGTLDDPVHAINLQERTIQIPPDAFILAVDACLTKQVERVGFVGLFEGPLYPGLGVHKSLQPVGNMHISMITNCYAVPSLIHTVLTNTRLSVVMKGVNFVVQNIQNIYRLRQEVAC